MTVNISKHRNEILNAYNNVIDESSSINWALFGYEGSSSVLRLDESGDGGLEELTTYLNSGRLMYALCSIVEPETQTRRLVLINWQGEGAPARLHGLYAAHIYEMKKLFRGVHMVIQARCEEDIEEDCVLSQLKKCTTAGPIPKASGCLQEQAPVGTRYNRINPSQEINAGARDKFWESAEKEEAQRIEMESRRRSHENEFYQQEKTKLQQEISQKLHGQCVVSPGLQQQQSETKQKKPPQPLVQETKAPALKQLALFEQRNGQLAQNSIARCPVSNKAANCGASKVSKWPPVQTEPSRASEVVNRSNAEADTVISKCSNSVNGTEDASNEQKSNRVPPKLLIPPVNESTLVPPLQICTDVTEPPKHDGSNEATSASFADTIRRVKPPDSDDESEQDWDEPPLEDGPSADTLEESAKLSLMTGLHSPSQPRDPSSGLCAQALYDYQAADDTEISFDPGDVISHIEQIDPGWWQGMAPDGTFGLFPANYVQLI